jgi:hypothetical protein
VEVYRPRFIRIPFTTIDPTFVSTTEFPQKKNNPEAIILHQNFPNPAKLTTQIKFEVTRKGFVHLQLNSMEGREIQSYVNKVLDIGTYIVDIDLQNLKHGVYTYSINNSSFKLIKN